MKDALKLSWIAVNGNIRTKEEFRVKPDLGRAYFAPIWIAFNVGQEMAEHIVKTHNDKLRGFADVECITCSGTGLLESDPDSPDPFGLNSMACLSMRGNGGTVPTKREDHVLVAFICPDCKGAGFRQLYHKPQNERALLGTNTFDRVYATYDQAARRGDDFVPFNEFNTPGSVWKIEE